MIHFSLKLECEKLASEKMEIQRHYVMVIIEIASMHEQLSSWCIKVDLFAAINDRLAAAQPASHSLGPECSIFSHCCSPAFCMC